MFGLFFLIVIFGLVFITVTLRFGMESRSGEAVNRLRCRPVNERSSNS